ncbi:MAG TPA: aldehyde ferredoxin oxidoreductase C-terminal domain-containing protein [Symbiobacteriaceae bacterium]|nr:aldehyde ferredoxin oxidoreductase C-terminal domain-containing protein [Symbiobacteriaceae bacterium]
MNKLLRVNLTESFLRSEALPEAYKFLGGRALTSRIVADEVNPLADPLGPHNRLVFAPGLLSGTTLSSSSRISVGAKSPLTGGIKEANAGGETGLYLAQAGYRAVVVEGARPAGDWVVLVVDADGNPRLEAAADLTGIGSFETAKRLFERYGRDAALALIGPTGEMRMSIAGIGNTDREGRPSRLAARGGLGAVMGAKGLKALVVLGDARHPLRAVDPELWKQSQKTYNQGLQTLPATKERYPTFGTAATLELVNKLGGLPTRNFARGQFEQVDKISGITMRETILERGGEGTPTHSCMAGCVIRCSNVFPDSKGREIASSMEFETNALFGSNMEIADFDWIARYTWLCNDLGSDTIETAGAIGVAMQAGVLPFGDAHGVAHLLDEEIRRGTPLGRILGGGAAHVGRTYGVREVPVVKGQTFAAYDPRAIKGNGVTYVTSPMGADHTAGNTIAAKTDQLDPAGKVALSRTVQIANMAMDMLGFCAFARGVSDLSPDAFEGFFAARLGENWNWSEVQALALDALKREVAFNRAAGLGRETDRLPEWMRETPLPPHQALFDVDEAELARIWDEE